jgi:mannose-6-phosphate isomerase-like protein (cupin superfamily)
MIKNCFINGSKKVITPWGVFEQFCLNKKVTVKILTIKKNQEISLQKHSKRNEFWRIISGKGQIIIGNSKKIASFGKEFFIPKNTLHRAKATSKEMLILEISFGKFDEKDIVRLDDKYKRKCIS